MLYPQVIYGAAVLDYGCNPLDSCALDSVDMGANGRQGCMVTLRMRLLCEVIRAGQSQPEQVIGPVFDYGLVSGDASELLLYCCSTNAQYMSGYPAHLRTPR